MKGAADPESPFRRNLSRLNHLIDSGTSFSGYERNCAFLNLGAGKRFATVSAITGFDFDDDARAIGLSDWDRDGDLDVWVQNRTAPMLRYLRNDFSGKNRSLQIRLQGTRSNRDAIGARVEVSTSSGRFYVKTLKAGEGFLSQGSKWLHFGLGEKEKVNTLTVKWPGGEEEKIVDAATSGRFLIVEGSGKAVTNPTNPPSKQLTPVEKVVSKKAESSASKSALATRFPLPPLHYQSFEGEKSNVKVGDGKPILINIWASWCAPCAAELKSFVDHKTKLNQTGLDVIALSVDGLTDDSETGPKEAKALVQKLNLPFTAGMATPETLRRIEFLHNLPYGLAESLPVPTSLLIDRSGGLAAIYRGEVKVDAILQDIASLDLKGNALLDWPLPFSNHRWIGRAQPKGYFDLPADLIENGQLIDASIYLKTNVDLLRKGDAKRLSFFHGRLGIRFEEAGNLRACIGEFEAALAIDPNNVEVCNNLAWQLSGGKDLSLRNGPRALKLAEFAAKATGFKHPAVLDTLAAALAQNGRYREALEIAQRGAEIARKSGQDYFFKSLTKGIEDYSNQRPRSPQKD